MKMKTILFTGGAGFIGSNVINHFLKNLQNINIVNLDKLDYCSNEKFILSQYNYTFIQGDINNTELVTYILNHYKVNYVLHFAAQSHVDNSFSNSKNFTIDNVCGTHNLLECSRLYGKLDKFIHVSTDEVYGEVLENDESKTEKSILNPTNPYAASKAAAEFYVKTYNIAFGLPIIITRANNVFGPNQYPEKLIPKFINLLLHGKKCTIHGNGNHKRSFIYTEDICNAFEVIFIKGIIGETYNIGSTDEYSVFEILHILHKKLCPEKSFEQTYEFITNRPFNDFRYKVDDSKLISLGWQKKIPFDQGINLTINWYKDKFTKNN